MGILVKHDCHLSNLYAYCLLPLLFLLYKATYNENQYTWTYYIHVKCALISQHRLVFLQADHLAVALKLYNPSPFFLGKSFVTALALTNKARGPICTGNDHLGEYVDSFPLQPLFEPFGSASNEFVFSKNI